MWKMLNLNNYVKIDAIYKEKGNDFQEKIHFSLKWWSSKVKKKVNLNLIFCDFHVNYFLEKTRA